MGAALTALLAALSSATSGTAAANLIGGHLTSSSQMKSSVQALLALVNPTNAASIAQHIASIPGVPMTVTALLGPLSEAKDAPTVTTISIEINGALNAQHGIFASILSSL